MGEDIDYFDLKKMQKKLSSLYSNSKPSEVTDIYWLYAFRKKGQYPERASKGGKWLVFVDQNEVDKVWEIVKKAVEEGKLGNEAKVATAKPNPHSMNSTERVICVYTYDWTDQEDVRRIREELRKLGIEHKIPYKADQDTLDGRYRKTGHTKISKYYE